MIDTYLAAGLFAYEPREFLSLERGFHQLKNVNALVDAGFESIFQAGSFFEIMRLI